MADPDRHLRAALARAAERGHLGRDDDDVLALIAVAEAIQRAAGAVERLARDPDER